MSEPDKKEPVKEVVCILDDLRKSKLFPNGKRYLLVDSYGVCLYSAMYKSTKDEKYIKLGEDLIKSVKKELRVENSGYLSSKKKDGQFYHFLLKWIYCLNVFGDVKPQYKLEAIELIKEIHPKFYVKDKGMNWKMKNDLSGEFYKDCPKYNPCDFFEGLVVYRLCDPEEKKLKKEIGEIKELVDKYYKNFKCVHDMENGILLWLTSFNVEEEWSKYVFGVVKKNIKELWVEVNDKCGYYMREDGLSYTKFPFTNYIVAIALKSRNLWTENVEKLITYFKYSNNEEWDKDPMNPLLLGNLLLPSSFIKEKIVEKKN